MKTILPMPFWFLILMVLALFSTNAIPQIAQTDPGEYQIKLYNEKCKLDAVSNLPGRAVWFEKDKQVEGCFGVNQQTGMVVLYFADKTVAAVPLQLFSRVTST